MRQVLDNEASAGSTFLALREVAVHSLGVCRSATSSTVPGRLYNSTFYCSKLYKTQVKISHLNPSDRSKKKEEQQGEGDEDTVKRVGGVFPVFVYLLKFCCCCF